MKKQIEIVVPNNWSAITLRKYIQLSKDLKNFSDDEEAQTAALFFYLCDLEPLILPKIDAETFLRIKDNLYSFLSDNQLPLQQKINLNGVEYGFYPNLSKIEYGAYVDISKYNEMELDEKWAEVMSILYRPITKRMGNLYEVESYSGKIDREVWLDVTMDVHFGAWFFFINLSKELLKGILNSTKEAGLPPNIKSILERSGEIIQLL
jgi:hypothetical protein